MKTKTYKIKLKGKFWRIKVKADYIVTTENIIRFYQYNRWSDGTLRASGASSVIADFDRKDVFYWKEV